MSVSSSLQWREPPHREALGDFINRKTHVNGLTFCLEMKNKINLLINKETLNVFPSLPILTQFWTSRLEVIILMFTISIFVWKHMWGRNRLTAVKLRKGLILFFGHHAACGTLVPQSGIKPTSLAVGARSLNPWPTREVPAPPGKV